MQKRPTLSAHSQLSRRSFAHISLVATIATATNGIVAGIRNIELPEEFTPGESILDKEVPRYFETQLGRERIVVTLRSPLCWEVNGTQHALSELIIDGTSYPLDNNIPNATFTPENTVLYMIAADDNSGIDIETTLGRVFIPMDHFDKTVFALAHPQPVSAPQDQTNTNVTVSVDIAPNPGGQILLEAARANVALQNLIFSRELNEIALPDTVEIAFVSDTPPPVREPEPITPLLTAEQMAALSRERDKLISFLSPID